MSIQTILISLGVGFVALASLGFFVFLDYSGQTYDMAFYEQQANEAARMVRGTISAVNRPDHLQNNSGLRDHLVALSDRAHCLRGFWIGSRRVKLLHQLSDSIAELDAQMAFARSPRRAFP